MTTFFVDDAHADVGSRTILRGTDSGYVLAIVEDGTNERLTLLHNGGMVAEFSLGKQGYAVNVLKGPRI